MCIHLFIHPNLLIFAFIFINFFLYLVYFFVQFLDFWRCFTFSFLEILKHAVSLSCGYKCCCWEYVFSFYVIWSFLWNTERVFPFIVKVCGSMRTCAFVNCFGHISLVPHVTCILFHSVLFFFSIPFTFQLHQDLCFDLLFPSSSLNIFSFSPPIFFCLPHCCYL